MSNTLFISDLHLDDSRPAVTRAFLDLLEGEAASADALYILGDLFETWVGDDDDSTLADSVRTALKRCPTDIFFMRGNRDFLVASDFAEETQTTLLEDPTVIDLYGTRTVLLHGDTLCTRDIDYLEWRKKCRSDAFQNEFLAQPLEVRRQIVAGLRQQSAEASSNKPEDIMDVTGDEVVAVMRDHNAPLMIHGHTHRPARHQNSAGERIVLGDWTDTAWLIRANAQSTELVEFSIA